MYKSALKKVLYRVSILFGHLYLFRMRQLEVQNLSTFKLTTRIITASNQSTI